MTASQVIASAPGSCVECYRCVRECPVKAIGIESGNATVLDDRCIYCGRCLGACSQNVFSLRDEIERVRGLLRTGTPVVALIAPEYFLGRTAREFSLLVPRMLGAGFEAVEDTFLAMELVSREYQRLLEERPDRPMIRSTCPAAVSLVRIYHPELCEYLAPISSPMAVAGRYARTVYPSSASLVYVGPCVAAKVEKSWYDDRPVDACLTFAELDELLEGDGYDSDRAPSANGVTPWVTVRPSVRLKGSQGGGPIDVLSGYDEFRRLAEVITAGERTGLVDVLGCKDCAGGITLPTSDDFVTVSLEQLLPALPPVEIGRVLRPRLLELDIASAEQIESILRQGNRHDPARRLNCGGCGYDTCEELAQAIYDGRATWFACFPTQRDDYSRHAAELMEASRTDSLTELLNHRGFMERLHEEIQRARRYQTTMSLLMIDVDRFKEINDTYGHIQGDRVLRLLSQILQTTLRETDIAARYGGDEFAVVLPQTGAKEAVEVAEKLRAKVEQTTFYIDEDHFEKLTLSVGVSDTAGKAVEPVVILSWADRAMYEAKKGGRNRVRLHE